MLTPKEKKVLNKTVTAKKKRVFRILQGNYCSPYCLNANNQMKNSLEMRIKNINDRMTDQLMVQKIESNKNSSERSKSKMSKTKKFPEMVFGLNETFKCIDKNQISMIWLDQSLAMNIKNIIQKLCSNKEVLCVNIDLKKIQTLLNISSLAVIAFKSSILKPESLFNQLYQLIIKWFNIPTEYTLENKLSILAKGIQVTPSAANFYLNLKLDPYKKIMKEKLKFNSEKLQKNEFIDNLSFVPLSFKSEEYFPNYSNQIVNDRQLNVELMWPDKTDRNEMVKILGTQLYESCSNENVTKKFKTPKLIKSTCNEEKLTVKRQKRIVNKEQNNLLMKKMKIS